MEALARQEKLEADKRRKPEASGKPITGSQYPSIVKTAVGSKQIAQPVSVIQTASVATIAKSRMPSSAADAARLQSAKVAGRTVASLLCEQRVLPGKVPTKTVASLLSEHNVKPATMTATTSGQSPAASTAARAVRPGQQHIQNVVTSQNVLIVLDRLLSATNSMNVFLQSLRMDARKNAVGNTPTHLEKRREIAGKLTRAYAAYTRSFQEVATHSSSPAAASNLAAAAGASQMARVNAAAAKVQQGSVVVRAPPASAQSRPISNQRSVLGHPPAKSNSSEVIEISDSEDDRSSVSVVKGGKNPQPSTSQKNVVVPVISAKLTEGRLITAAPVKVVSLNPTNTKKRARSPEVAAENSVPKVAAKRACPNNSGESDRKPRATSAGEDGVMFDGGVDEIPQDDAESSSDNHHLQMYCVEVNEEDSDDGDDAPLSNIKLENGRLPATTTASGRAVKQPRSLLEAELTRSASTARSVVS